MGTDIRQAVEGNLADWQGLSLVETVARLSNRLGPLAERSEPEDKTRFQKRFRVSTLIRMAPPRRIEAWVLLGSDHIDLVEVDDPLVPNIDRLLESLGPADTIVPGKRYQAGAMVREHVYAGRGMTLSVATPFGGGSGGTKGQDSIIHLQLFPATTVERWVTEIGAGPELHPFPRR